MDHYGNIGFLDENIPVVASPVTLALLKGLQDSLTLDSGSEVVYMNKKKPDPSDSRILNSAKRCGRSLITTNIYNDNFEEFMWSRSRKTIQIEKGELRLLKDCELPFNIEAYETDHSVYGSLGYILEGDHSIAYTGDT